MSKKSKRRKTSEPKPPSPSERESEPKPLEKKALPPARPFERNRFLLILCGGLFVAFVIYLAIVAASVFFA